jgi:hypothetical protein
VIGGPQFDGGRCRHARARRHGKAREPRPEHAAKLFGMIGGAVDIEHWPVSGAIVENGPAHAIAHDARARHKRPPR